MWKRVEKQIKKKKTCPVLGAELTQTVGDPDRSPSWAVPDNDRVPDRTKLEVLSGHVRAVLLQVRKSLRRLPHRSVCVTLSPWRYSN